MTSCNQHHFNRLERNLMKLTSSLQLVDKLQEGGKIDNLQCVWRFWLCTVNIIGSRTNDFSVGIAVKSTQNIGFFTTRNNITRIYSLFETTNSVYTYNISGREISYIFVQILQVMFVAVFMACKVLAGQVLTLAREYREQEEYCNLQKTPVEWDVGVSSLCHSLQTTCSRDSVHLLR